MSKLSAVGKLVSGILGTGQPAINMPKPEIPAVPTTAVNDTGQDVTFGADAATKNQRVSGRSVARRTTKTSGILGGLGQSGLNI